ncbi:response regulator transcription factor [Ruminococcaceae bacterium OttesenSCG-928-A11]|nr:response regulator transcription factor [Ruminococcaceae bacterium OttesenSCG-928-A11]
MMATILVVDDEVEIADLVELYLINERHTVRKHNDPKAALEDNLGGVDAAILDVMMPGMDGFELCRTLRAAGHTFPVIMLTAKDADGDKINGLAIGADDYVVKPFNPLELMARVNAQLRRAQVFSPGAEPPKTAEEYDINGLWLRPEAHTCTLYGKPVELTPTEYAILLLLCRNRGRVISSEEIFEAVWGEKYLDSNNTVMVHIQKLRKKLDDTGKRKKFIQTMWGVGYKIDDTV